jgi:hypothetical protein
VPDAIHRLVEEAVIARRTDAESTGHVKREQVIRAEAGVDAQHRKTAQQEAGADRQHQRDRNLGDEERIPEPETSSCGFRTGRTRSRIWSSSENIAVFAPIPRASEIVATAANSGLRSRPRRTTRRLDMLTSFEKYAQ